VTQLAQFPHQLKTDHLGRDAAEAGAGAMGPGGDRTGDRLRVDVAEVRHRQAQGVERGVQFLDRGAGTDGDKRGVQVRGYHAGPPGQVERDA